MFAQAGFPGKGKLARLSGAGTRPCWPVQSGKALARHQPVCLAEALAKAGGRLGVVPRAARLWAGFQGMQSLELDS
jgi:hypothetical protein